MKRRQDDDGEIVKLDWDAVGKPPTSTRPVRHARGLRLTDEIRPDGDSDQEVLLRSFRELMVALSMERKTHLTADPLCEPFELWGDGPDAYFDAFLPNLFGVNLDLCVNDGHVFVRIER
jgi:hypothetical protein